MSQGLEINVPHEIPVMTLPDVAFFPQALLPLHIFEPRYLTMLGDVLASNRLFAVAGLNSSLAESGDQAEPPHRVAGIGMVRACQKSENGTWNLLLQGLARVEILQAPANDDTNYSDVATVTTSFDTLAWVAFASKYARRK